MRHNDVTIRMAWANRHNDLSLQAGHGIGHLHANRIMHRDVRAVNFLVASRDPLRVCATDFGLSHAMADVRGKDYVQYSVKGPTAWLAPELLKSTKQVVTTKTDVYMFGC